MKYHTLTLALGAFFCLSLSSCFKDEPLNAEADIEQAWMHADDVKGTFYNPTDTLINVLSTDSVISFYVRPYADRTALAPTFQLTEGATITPANGSVHNFKDSVIVYTVASQDGLWTRNYKVSVQERQTVSDDEWLFDFENYGLDDGNKYYVWTDTDYTDVIAEDRWATGNPGFRLSKGSAKPEEYPTAPTEGLDGGHGVKLTTRDTGRFGQMANMRIAAGNLFIGKFDVSQAMKNAMKATQFGLPVAQKPLYFSGSYKYKPGETFQDRKGNPVAGKTDTGNIYAVFYRNVDSNGSAFVLHGDDVLTSSQIVATAVIDEVKTTDEWLTFHIPFTYLKEVDAETLEAYGYSLAIVFSSSEKGAEFEGAVGSTLIVDKVTITWE